MKRYCQVRILDVPLALDRPFTYCHTETEGEPIPVRGSFVSVPFGKGNRAMRGIVTDVSALPPEKIKGLKSVITVLSPSFTLGEEQLKTAEFIREQTVSTFGEAAHCMIPAGALQRLYHRYTAQPGCHAEVELRFGEASGELALYELLAAKDAGVASTSLGTVLPALTERDERLCALVDAGFAEKTLCVSQGENVRLRSRYVSAVPEEDLAALAAGDADTKKKYGLSLRSAAYGAIFEALTEDPDWDGAALLAKTGATQANLNLLEKHGVIEKKTVTENRLSHEWEADGGEGAKELSEEQTRAVATLTSLYEAEGAKAALLWGVTGSGKTHVIKAMADRVIRDGKQVILLVPEISLTPQSVRIFCAAYRGRVAVLHSGLSEGERLDEWRRIRAGEADMVIGTRSAIFAPVPRLGMIVIDEEQEHTYKSDTSPKYHARDVARFRCAHAGALMVLASATPSLESFYKAKEGVYTLVTLQNRYGGAVLPQVIFADTRLDRDTGNTSSVSSVLQKEMEENLAAHQQSILFLNRRGYHNYVACLSCGEPVVCPHCSVTMTAHLAGGRRTEYDTHGAPKNLVLICHYCGYRCAPPDRCPSCHSEHLMHFGFGTQRTEDAIAHLFPAARVLRMDADTTKTKDSHRKILDAFRAGDADILLGTQMVTKGHDFPNVTLSAVLNADAMLAQDDFRASERTFSVIVQMLGRAGRGALAGRAVIQTSNPDNRALRLAAKQDYEAFYEGAIAVRRSLSFPPFCDIVLLSLTAKAEHDLDVAGTDLYTALAEATAERGEYSDVPLEIFGPFEAQIYRVAETYRKRLIVKCRSNKRTRALLRELVSKFGADWSGKVSLGIDINPTVL